MLVEKDKNCEKGFNFGVSREEKIFISCEEFDQCEIFSWHTDVFNPALQLSAPRLKLSNDHSGKYKTIFAQKTHFGPFGG